MVKMAGVEIGRVEKIELENDPNSLAVAKVTMKIKDDFKIKTDAKAIIKFTGLMGQNYVAIEGGSPRAAVITKGSALDSAEQPDLSALMVKLESVATGVEGLTKSFSTEGISTLLGPLTDFMNQNKGPLTAMIANFRSISDNLAQGNGTAGRLLKDDSLFKSALGLTTNLQSASSDLKNLMTNANNAVVHVDGVFGQAGTLIARINAGQGTLGLLATDDKLYKDTSATLASLRQIVEKMSRGEGTVGKLINNDDFYKNAKLSLQKLDKATEGLEDQGPLSVLGIIVNNLF
jgi:phospholipid/cholesterol/gamma-HCH transport system substrate-binding protein